MGKWKAACIDAPEKVQLRRVRYVCGKSGHEVTRVINPFASYFTRGDAHARHYFHDIFVNLACSSSSDLRRAVALGPPFGKPPFCSRSECVRDDKRLASPSRSRMV